MKTVIVYDHPYNGSFCNGILQAVISGLKKSNHQIDIINLHEDSFNPVMSQEDLKAFRDKNPVDSQVLQYKSRLENADSLIFIFPIWWELMPAMTKGFIDKVIFPSIAYDYTNGGIGMKPLLRNLKNIKIITTMNTPNILYRLKFGNAISKALITGTFKKMGYSNCKLINFSMVKFVSKEKREKWLSDLEKKFTKISI